MKFRTIEHNIRLFNDFFSYHESMPLAYEDLVTDPTATNELLGFLGVEARPLSVALQRQNPQPLSSLVENYDELKKAFAGTRHKVYFDD